jgi:hypothetical protein
MLSEQMRNTALNLDRRLRDDAPIEKVEGMLLLVLIERWAEEAHQLEVNGCPIERPAVRVVGNNVVTADFTRGRK